MRRLSLLLDHATFPFFLIPPLFAGWALLRAGIPNALVTPIVVTPLALFGWLLEQLRPERPHLEREVPLYVEAAHFLFNFEVGYGLGLLASAGIARAFRLAVPSFWPGGWPVPLQFILCIVLYEGSSYWQHRFFHRYEKLWNFHRLHHGGARMDITRSSRFHIVDFSTVSFLAYLPLVLVGTPEDIITLMAIFVSGLGLSHHGNFRARTPGWLDWVICTPALHRRHHSLDWRESDANFANTVMIFDLLFGTFARPDPAGPAALGTEEPLPRGFFAQVWEPFARLRG